jgi:hypothetical protein
VARLVVEDQPVIAALGQHLALEIERAHVQREAVHEDDGRLAGRLLRLDDLDVQAGAVRGGDRQLLVERLYAELLVPVRVTGLLDRLLDQRPLDGERGGQPGRRDTDHRADDADLLGSTPFTSRAHP